MSSDDGEATSGGLILRDDSSWVDSSVPITPHEERYWTETNSNGLTVLRRVVRRRSSIFERTTADWNGKSFDVTLSASITVGLTFGALKSSISFSFGASFHVDIGFPNDPPKRKLLGYQGILYTGESVSAGTSIIRVASRWHEIGKGLSVDWTKVARELSPTNWEEFAAGLLLMEGFEKVILTPRSGDGGKDVVATRSGPLAMKVFAQMKAFSPGHVVGYDDLRSLMGVIGMDVSVTKGLLITTSSFPPRLSQDEHLRLVVPYRLELWGRDELLQRIGRNLR